MQYTGGAFEPPTPAQAAAMIRRTTLPDNEIPAPLDWVAVLGRSENVAVALVNCAVYSTGLALDVTVRVHGAADPNIAHAAFSPIGDRELLLLGVEYPDGRTATNAENVWPPPADPEKPTLSQGGGGGGERRVDMSMFLSPLPPAGPLTVVCGWPRHGIAETHTQFDGRTIPAAAARVIELWPYEPPDLGPRMPEPPELPDDDGWFARASRR